MAILATVEYFATNVLSNAATAKSELHKTTAQRRSISNEFGIFVSGLKDWLKSSLPTPNPTIDPRMSDAKTRTRTMRNGSGLSLEKIECFVRSGTVKKPSAAG